MFHEKPTTDDLPGVLYMILLYLSSEIKAETYALFFSEHDGHVWLRKTFYYYQRFTNTCVCSKRVTSNYVNEFMYSNIWSLSKTVTGIHCWLSHDVDREKRYSIYLLHMYANRHYFTGLFKDCN